MHSESEASGSRVKAVSFTRLRALLWIGPLLMVLGTAVGSGEILQEPSAGAKYGSALLWVIVLIVVTKAIWNEAVGRVSIVTGQSFLEVCSSAGRAVAWVPWAWFALNLVRDFFLRGGITAIGGIICYDVFGPLPIPSRWLASAGDIEAQDAVQCVAWTFLNYAGIWMLLVVGGYRLAERLTLVFCTLFSLCLISCAAVVLPGVIGELAGGLVPSLPSRPGELLMVVSLAGIVMAGSATIYCTGWVEERGMGLFDHVRRSGRRISREEIEPRSDEEVRRMNLWLRINRINVTLIYSLGAAICLSTFVLGVAVLGPAGVTLKGPALARELSLMMTDVVGPWAKGVFYLGAWAAVVSTAVGILDGSSRMFTQPIRQLAPAQFARLSVGTWQKILMTLMIAGSGFVYLLVPDAVMLVTWMGAIDAPLVGILILAYAYLCRWYLPAAYRRGPIWTLGMAAIGVVYLGVGIWFFIARILAAVGS